MAAGKALEIKKGLTFIAKCYIIKACKATMYFRCTNPHGVLVRGDFSLAVFVVLFYPSANIISSYASCY